MGDLVYQYTQSKTREWPVPAGTLARAAVVSASNEPGVTITPRGDSTVTKTLADGSTVTFANGAVGQRSDSATVAIDGSWSFAVTGASSSTPKNTLVYAVVASGAVTSLTLTASTNVKFGVTDSYPGNGSASDTVVKIGVFA